MRMIMEMIFIDVLTLKQNLIHALSMLYPCFIYALSMEYGFVIHVLFWSALEQGYIFFRFA